MPVPLCSFHRANGAQSPPTLGWDSFEIMMRTVDDLEAIIALHTAHAHPISPSPTYFEVARIPARNGSISPGHLCAEVPLSITSSCSRIVATTTTHHGE